MMPGLAQRDPRYRYQRARQVAEVLRRAVVIQVHVDHGVARDDDGHDEEGIDDRHQRRCERVDNGPDRLQAAEHAQRAEAGRWPTASCGIETETTMKSKHKRGARTSSSVKTLAKRRSSNASIWAVGEGENGADELHVHLSFVGVAKKF